MLQSHWSEKQEAIFEGKIDIFSNKNWSSTLPWMWGRFPESFIEIGCTVGKQMANRQTDIDVVLQSTSVLYAISFLFQTIRSSILGESSLFCIFCQNKKLMKMAVRHSGCNIRSSMKCSYDCVPLHYHVVERSRTLPSTIFRWFNMTYHRWWLWMTVQSFHAEFDFSTPQSQLMRRMSM